MKSNSKNDLVKLLSICGQVAEYKSEKMCEYGVDESQILSALSQEEQTQLGNILRKQQSHWLEEHARHHKGG